MELSDASVKLEEYLNNTLKLYLSELDNYVYEDKLSVLIDTDNKSISIYSMINDDGTLNTKKLLIKRIRDKDIIIQLIDEIANLLNNLNIIIDDIYVQKDTFADIQIVYVLPERNI